MSAQSSSSAPSDKLRQRRDNEIQFLQNLQGVIQQAKRELSEDLTRLAIKNMPFMIATSEQRNQATCSSGDDNRAGSSQTSIPSVVVVEQDSAPDLHQLETLDLDV